MTDANVEAMSEPVYRLDDLLGYDILILPGIIGNPPADGLLVQVRTSGVTCKRVAPTIRVRFDA